MWYYFVLFALAFGLGECRPNVGPGDMGALRNPVDKDVLKKSIVAQFRNAGVGSGPYPDHAQCEIDWTFGVDCPELELILVNQIKAWTGSDKCNTKDENNTCGSYQLFWSYDDFIYFMHQTTDNKHLDMIYILLTSTSYGCNAWSVSYTTEVLMEIFDGGRNFCNVMNLVEGAGLTQLPHYSRDTSEERCTQFTTADCTA